MIDNRKIFVFSDIHLEFLKVRTFNSMVSYLNSVAKDGIDSAEMVIVPGDLGNVDVIEMALKALRKICGRKEVIFVAGNHEYYQDTSLAHIVLPHVSESTHIVEHNATIERLCKKNDIAFLNNSVFEWKHIRFVGSTGWYPYTAEMAIDKRKTNDSYHMDWQEIHQENDKSRSFLMNEIKDGDVVISHFLPFPMQGDTHPSEWSVIQLPSSFIYDIAPRYWIFGHIHTSVNDNFGFDIVCNPVGYPFSVNQTFSKGKL